MCWYKIIGSMNRKLVDLDNSNFSYLKNVLPRVGENVLV